MKYSCLLTNPELEVPLFYNNITEECEIIYEHYSSYIYGKKWDALKAIFKDSSIYRRSNLLGYNLLVSRGFILVKEEEDFKILACQTNKALYLDKELPTTYRKLYLKFKNEIEEIYNSNVDIIYTNNCGKNSFIQFETPKFKSISDRKEYVGELLDEYYETR